MHSISYAPHHVVPKLFVDSVDRESRPQLTCASVRDSRAITVCRCLSLSLLIIHEPGLPSVWSNLDDKRYNRFGTRLSKN